MYWYNWMGSKREKTKQNKKTITNGTVGTKMQHLSKYKVSSFHLKSFPCSLVQWHPPLGLLHWLGLLLPSLGLYIKTDFKNSITAFSIIMIKRQVFTNCNPFISFSCIVSKLNFNQININVSVLLKISTDEFRLKLQLDLDQSERVSFFLRTI